MAQERSFNYLDNDSTFELNRRLMGIFGAGRYRGFEADTMQNDMTLRLVHTTGHLHVAKDLTSKTVGLILTKQGVAIREDAGINLTIEPNNNSQYYRVDLIVCEHQYVDVTGGATALYKVIKGPYEVEGNQPQSQLDFGEEPGELGSGGSGGGLGGDIIVGGTPVEPDLPNPNAQTIIGRLFIPPNTTQLTKVGVEYKPAPIPALAASTELEDKLSELEEDFNRQIANYSIVQLNDIIFNGIGSGSIMYYDSTDSKFKFKNFAKWIQETKWIFDGSKTRHEGNSREITTNPSATYSQAGGGGDVVLMDIGSTANRLFINFETPGGPVFHAPIDGIKGDATVGTMLYITYLPDSEIVGFYLNSATLQSGLKILKGGASGLWSPTAGRTFRLYRRPDAWEILD